MADRFTPYQRRLFLFLSVATFFEGYDFLALTQILPEVREEMHLSEGEGGLLIGFINLGTVVAYLLVRQADRWGRRRVLTITIAGYTILTALSGFAPNVWVFAILQHLARIFLIGEWATSMVIAAEEFPPARRGFVIGVIQAFSSLGAIVCAGVVPLLLRSAYGWRTVYFVGIVPLVILAFARRGLKETQKFAAGAGKDRPARPILHIWYTPHRKRLLQMALIWGVTYICTQNGVTFFKEFAKAERNMTNDEIGAAISIAALASMPLIFYAGKLLDQIGRRWGGAVIFGLGSLGVLLAYSVHGFWPMTIALVFGIFGASAVMPVLNAYTTELFPTEVRGDAFAWSNNLLGRITYVLSPIAVGELAERYHWGPVIQATAVAPIIAVGLIFWLLPETKNRDLDDTAALH